MSANVNMCTRMHRVLYVYNWVVDFAVQLSDSEQYLVFTSDCSYYRCLLCIAVSYAYNDCFVKYEYEPIIILICILLLTLLIPVVVCNKSNTLINRICFSNFYVNYMYMYVNRLHCMHAFVASKWLMDDNNHSCFLERKKLLTYRI